MKLYLIFLSAICLLSVSCNALETNPANQINEVLGFWFGELSTPLQYPQEQNKIWFGGGKKLDQEITDRFESLVNDAADNKLNHWNESSRGRLALIILLDQFPRNIYRGTPKAFAFDIIAQQQVLDGIDLGQDQELFPVERVFFYLPLEHSEDLSLQELSISKFNRLSSEVDPSLTAIFENFALYAQRHFDIIEKFGRFPHRNQIMGRDSTSEELEFLKQPNSSF